MGVWIISGEERSVLYDSCVERPFGPGFHEREEAENFIRYVVAIGEGRRLNHNTREGAVAALEAIFDTWCRLTKCSECFESIDLIEMNESLDEDDVTFMERMEAHVSADDIRKDGNISERFEWSCAKCKERHAKIDAPDQSDRF